MSDKSIKIKLIKSTAGRLKSHKQCAIGLGLRRTNHQVTVIDTPENRGMIARIAYLLKVEEL